MVNALWRMVRPFVPGSFRPAVTAGYRAWMRGRCRVAAVQDRWRARDSGFAHVPPPSLRYRVHGDPDVRSFLRVGRRCRDDIESALREAGCDLEAFRRILDFGCGCGRTLLWFQDLAATQELHGCDIDADAIDWCRRHFGDDRFLVNGAMPPLDYDADRFDLLLAISVFTQLNESFQLQWLEELSRVVRPGGIALVTVHGEWCWGGLDDASLECLQKTGFLFRVSDRMKGIFPDWYQTAYHSRAYVERTFGRYFEIVEYIPRGLNEHQDVVVMKRRAGPFDSAQGRRGASSFAQSASEDRWGAG